MQNFAEKSDFEMRADPSQLELTLKAGNPQHRIAPIQITHDITITPIPPTEYSECMSNLFIYNDVSLATLKFLVRSLFQIRSTFEPQYLLCVSWTTRCVLKECSTKANIKHSSCSEAIGRSDD